MTEATEQQQAITRLTACFERRFGDRPAALARAPGRVNLIGEHTDYNGGFVLPMAIEQHTVAGASVRAGSDRLRLAAADLDEVVELELDAVRRAVSEGAGALPLERGSWASYVAGVLIVASRTHACSLPALDVAVASSVPRGAGLSSSAALEVSVAMAAAQLLGFDAPTTGLARLCQAAEHEFAGVPCGIMDQLASVAARPGCALLIDCRSLETTPIELGGDVSVVIADSRVHHELAAGAYAERRATCARAAEKLGAAELRDVGPEDVERAEGLDEPERSCARHVTTENVRTRGAAAALREGAFADVGHAMWASHASLRDDFRVSCRELDLLVEIASEIDGVYGCRMTGGGFGGSVVALARPTASEHLEAAWVNGYARQTGREPRVIFTAPGAGAAPIER